jgi:hypothetical protein
MALVMRTGPVLRTWSFFISLLPLVQARDVSVVVGLSITAVISISSAVDQRAARVLVHSILLSLRLGQSMSKDHEN